MKFHGVISKISYRKLELPMVKPFRIAIGSTNSYEGFLVSVTTDDGITGFGEATTTPFITGDTIGSIEYELRSFSETLVGWEESPEILNEFMKSTLRSSKASRNAIDCAVWDIIGKRSRTNVRKMLGNYRKKISTSYTVDLVDPKTARTQAQSLLAQGIEVFKIKMGSGIAEDLERARVVREVIGMDKMVYVDFNQSYTARKAIDISKKLAPMNIEFMEQPVPMHDIIGLKFARQRSDIPVFADESIFTCDDVLNVLGNEAADGINIKLMKCGGITEALKMASIAEAYRAPVMIGCMIETRLANTAGLDVALSRSAVKYSDLDGYSSIIEDIASDGITISGGQVSGPDIPGVGVTLREEYGK